MLRDPYSAVPATGPWTPYWLPLIRGPGLWAETPRAARWPQLGRMCNTWGALLRSEVPLRHPQDYQLAWRCPSRHFAVQGGCARGREKGEVKVQSERRLSPHQGGVPRLHPWPCSLFGGGWRAEARGNVALPPPRLLLLPNHRKPLAHPELLLPHIWAPALCVPPASPFCPPPPATN